MKNNKIQNIGLYEDLNKFCERINLQNLNKIKKYSDRFESLNKIEFCFGYNQNRLYTLLEEDLKKGTRITLLSNLKNEYKVISEEVINLKQQKIRYSE